MVSGRGGGVVNGKTGCGFRKLHCGPYLGVFAARARFRFSASLARTSRRCSAFATFTFRAWIRASVAGVAFTIFFRFQKTNKHKCEMHRQKNSSR